MEIPYTVEARPDTGLTNGKLGIWLFLASEVMLFGALFSTYILLRVGSTEWPHGELSVWLGAINTVILISSSVTMVMAWASLKLNDWGKHRLYLGLTLALAALFLANKYFEYSEHVANGEIPAHSTFLAIYYTLTGLHGLHVVVGIGVLVWIFLRNRRGAFSSEYFTPVDVAALYWHLVDLIWIYLFPLLYLID